SVEPHAAERRSTDGRGQPRRQARVLHELALRGHRPAVLPQGHRRLDGEGRCRHRRRHPTGPRFLHGVARRLPAASDPAAGRRRVVRLLLLSLSPAAMPADPGAAAGIAASWPWLALIGLGMFHGVNPAMGWLFAVALGMHRRSRAVVLAALVPIALGHALAVAIVVALVMSLGVAIDGAALRALGGVALIGWGAYHRLYGRRHRVRV